MSATSLPLTHSGGAYIAGWTKQTRTGHECGSVSNLWVSVGGDFKKPHTTNK